jgi:Winged helix-turn-helix DNA-binding
MSHWYLCRNLTYREISHRLGLSKNTVLDIVKRNRTLKFLSVLKIPFRVFSSTRDAEGYGGLGRPTA